jgi:tetratricopeptide (TPR) repeat protein
MLKHSNLRGVPWAVLVGMAFAAVVVTARVARAEPPRPAAASATPTPPAAEADPNASPASRTEASSTPPAGRTPPPSGEALEQARRHFDAALECYSRGRYRDAIAELEQARRLDPSGKDLVYNLALVHEKLGELEQALGYLRHYLAMETDPEERARTEASIARLEGALEEGYGAAPERAPSAPVLAALPVPAAPPGRLDAWVWGTGGVAVCALVVGAVLGLRALASSPGSDDGTGGSRSVDDVRSDAHAAHRSAIAADVAFGVAAVSGAAATLLYFGRAPQSPPAGPSAAAPSAAVELASAKLGVDLNFAF